MLILLATYRLPAEGAAPARAAIAAMVAATRAEPGCVEYAYSEDLLEPGLLRITEVWRDRAALEFHFATAHMAVWAAARTRFGLTERRVLIYDHADPPERIP